jgi:hypothetical protein
MTKKPRRDVSALETCCTVEPITLSREAMRQLSERSKLHQVPLCRVLSAVLEYSTIAQAGVEPYPERLAYCLF